MRQCLHPVYGSSRRPGHHSHEELRLRSDSWVGMNNDKKARGSMNSGEEEGEGEGEGESGVRARG